MTRTVTIAGRDIGPACPVYVIAEIGLSPGKSLENALALVDAAASGGADAAKFQTFSPTDLVSRHGRMARHFQGSDIVDAYRRMEFPREHYPAVVERCALRGITFLSSVFDLDSLAFLDPFSPSAYKIASFELGDRFLIEAVAERGRPVILSTGMASLAEVERAVALVEKAGNPSIVLLHTVSAYPSRPEDYNLRVIETLRRAFGHPVGVSDHTPDNELPTVATALGAAMLEKHITLDRAGSGPDDSFALDPDMLRDMVVAVRRTEAMLGDGRKRMQPAEADLHGRLQLALVAARELPAGAVLRRDDVTIKRSGGGIEPVHFDLVEGHRLRRAVATDEPFEWDHFLDRP